MMCADSPLTVKPFSFMFVLKIGVKGWDLLLFCPDSWREKLIGDDDWIRRFY